MSPKNSLLFYHKKGSTAKNIDKDPDLSALTSKKTSIKAIEAVLIDKHHL
jgi:hypothetical protein